MKHLGLEKNISVDIILDSRDRLDWDSLSQYIRPYLISTNLSFPSEKPVGDIYKYGAQFQHVPYFLVTFRPWVTIMQRGYLLTVKQDYYWAQRSLYYLTIAFILLIAMIGIILTFKTPPLVLLIIFISGLNFYALTHIRARVWDKNIQTAKNLLTTLGVDASNV